MDVQASALASNFIRSNNPSELNSLVKIWSDPLSFLTYAAAIATIILLLIAIIPPLVRWLKNFLDCRSLRKKIGAELYTTEDILSATQYYIRPSCQDVDPTQEEEIRLVHGVQADLFENVNKLLSNPEKFKYMIILADSGMGKTSFLLNYYAYHWRHARRRRHFHLAIVPLGIRNADSHIQKISDKSHTVLFLDALDEDTLAIQDHRKRLFELLEISREFRQVLITSRTQFFPKAEEIPRESGIIKIKDIAGGESREYLFYKLYLSPFSDRQVGKYLKKCFPLWRRKRRRKAREMVNKIQLLSVRPMILAHIKYLIKTEKSLNYSFQIYEEMVDAWLERERPFVKNKEVLREFSERMAIDLYINREERGVERIPYMELEAIAKKYSIELRGWQLRGRSLLNRDADGNYKFAHRSIMEYLFVKRFLDIEPTDRPKTGWTDQMKQFLMEMFHYWRETNQNIPDLSLVDFKGIIRLQLRANRKDMSVNEVKQMLNGLDFFDFYLNKKGKGVQHDYLVMFEKERVILDLATGLMWQQGGSSEYMNHEKAKEWIEELNRKGYAGYHDWRLPTLEEAMSLMEREKRNEELYIDPVFDNKQWWIWTSDLTDDRSGVWVVAFNSGGCSHSHFGRSSFVRAVRSGK